jgi:hypothetical protein
MTTSFPPPITRHGFHYYPDSDHYRMHNLESWMPELKKLGASWITLVAPAERAIPEFFLDSMLRANIQPVLHFPLPINQHLSVESFRLLFSNYARWGVKYVTLCDRPNLRINWQPSAWAQMDLVERFLDYYLPLAKIALQEGLTPVFPPLEPGGDYWDLAFLQTALRSLRRRGNEHLLEVLVLGANAFTGKHPIDWGAGGPERWPETRPYLTPPESQDHLGFRIFDWYLAISERELGERLPIILLRAGSLPGDHSESQDLVVETVSHAQTNLKLARLLSGDTEGISEREPVPPEVLACNFWLLSTHERSPYAGQAWFQSGKELPAVSAFHQWVSSLQKAQGVSESIASPVEQAKEDEEIPQAEIDDTSSPNIVFSGVDPERVKNLEIESDPSADLGSVTEPECERQENSETNRPVETEDRKTNSVIHPVGEEDTEEHPISHYVLLPLYAWGIANWDLALIQPLLEESHPTVGFSLEEARMAARVTVVGGEGAISPETMEMLRSSGCKVERVLEDGTLVAT